MGRVFALANGRTWTTQRDALAHFKNMLARYKTGDIVSDPSDHSDLAALLHHYDGFLASGQPTKVGVGIDHFSRQRNGGPGWSTDGFHVHARTARSTISAISPLLPPNRWSMGLR
jgi:hypothetical protein